MSRFNCGASNDAVPVAPFGLAAGRCRGRSVTARRGRAGSPAALNLTYRITDAAGTPFALRRPPLGMVLATATWGAVAVHLRARPVRGPGRPPVVFARHQSSAEFYLLRFVDGEVLGDAESGHRLAEGGRARSRASTPSTSSPPCTPSSRTRSVWATCAATAPTWSVSCAAGTVRCTPRRSRTWRSSTPRTVGSSPARPRCHRRTPGSRTATTGPATSPTARTGTSARSSTGAATLATRSPTSAG